MHTSANLSLRYERKTTTKTEPSSLRSLMASFARSLKKENSTLLSKALINPAPTLTSPETEMKSTTRYRKD